MTWRVLILLVISVGAAACRREAPAAEAQNDAEIAVPVAAQPARRGGLRAIVRTTGVVTPAAGAELMVTAPEPARIVDIPPAEGDRVARGDVLVRFDVPSAAAEAARHAADIARAQALLENARVAQARARELVERGIISRREMENADRELADAQAELARAESARQTSEAAAARGSSAPRLRASSRSGCTTRGTSCRGSRPIRFCDWSTRTVLKSSRRSPPPMRRACCRGRLRA